MITKMRKNNHTTVTFGIQKPEDTKRNRIIKKAVKKAVRDYRETFMYLANV